MIRRIREGIGRVVNRVRSAFGRRRQSEPLALPAGQRGGAQTSGS